jgi:hypothetical protein
LLNAQDVSILPRHRVQHDKISGDVVLCSLHESKLYELFRRHNEQSPDRSIAYRPLRLILIGHHHGIDADQLFYLSGKRLRDAVQTTERKLSSCGNQEFSGVSAEKNCFGECEATLGLASLNASDSSPYSNELTIIGSPFSNPPGCLSSAGQTPKLSRELPLPISALAALFINGEVLGMKCGMPMAAKSSPASPGVPMPLQPTMTQIVVLHFMFIDRFPFPKMRDNAINMSSIIDEEDFVRDMFTMPSFSIMPGALAWDPKAWRIEKYFADKWGFLFY